MAQSSMEPVTVRYRVRECCALLIVALATVILISLLSFSPLDVTSQGLAPITQNAIGIVGTLVSFTLFWTIGAVAYLLPFALLGSALALMLKPSFSISIRATLLQLCAVISVFFCLAILFHMHMIEIASMPEGPGGMIAAVIVFNAIPYLKVAGLSIVFSVAILMLLQYLFQFSWLNVLETTGKAIFVVSDMFMVLGRRMVVMFANHARILTSISSRTARRVFQSTKQSQLRLKAKEIVNLLPETLDSEPKKVIQSLVSDSHGQEESTKVSVPPIAGQATEPTILSKLPSLEILSSADEDKSLDESERNSLLELGERLRQILADYKVSIEVESIITGPVVSRFEIQLAPGSKVSKIVTLADDLAREIAVGSVRVVPVIPGKSVVGIEIPNAVRATVSLKDCLSSTSFENAKQPLTLALGKDIAGEAVYANIERMPHLLVAGTTGSGKSVGINTMLLSLLYRLTPEDVRMIMIDPKMLELSVYEGIPHLLTPVVTDMQDAAKALQWCVGEMERRYRLMRELQVRNLGGMNEKVLRAEESGEFIPDPLWDPASGEEQQVLAKLPLIVVIIDEFADMIMIVGKKIEQLIARIAQKARAAGIHLVLATQRPSVDVITGLIKANIPCRISYKVSSQVDSRTILDQIGAEQLLGHGDMLYLAPGSSVPERVHGAFVSDEEVLAVIDEWRQRGTPDYVLDIMSDSETLDLADLGLPGADDPDDLYQQAVHFVLESKRASASALQTKFQIGWNKAARFMDQMEGQGLVSQPDQNGRREVLVIED